MEEDLKGGGKAWFSATVVEFSLYICAPEHQKYPLFPIGINGPHYQEMYSRSPADFSESTQQVSFSSKKIASLLNINMHL